VPTEIRARTLVRTFYRWEKLLPQYANPRPGPAYTPWVDPLFCFVLFFRSLLHLQKSGPLKKLTSHHKSSHSTNTVPVTEISSWPSLSANAVPTGDPFYACLHDNRFVSLCSVPL
jgi:hypothetical protein